MTTELAYISEKFQDIELLENFVPLLNKHGQAKLAFVEAIPGLETAKDGSELPRLQFRFMCQGVNESRLITYTGWIKEAFGEISKLGAILKGFKIITFPTPEATTVKEFDFENNFNSSKEPPITVKLDDLLAKLNELEGVIVLAKLKQEDNVWHRPDPKTFEFPLNKNGEYYRVDVKEFKKD